MATATWLNEDTEKALSVWVEYSRAHDLSTLIGQTAGIDPVSGDVWIGKSDRAVVDQMQAAGIDRPLYFVRVGSNYYERKGGQR